MKPARGPILWWLKSSRYKAITLPPFGIYALPEHLEDPRLRRHEEAHWQQAKQYGTLGFYARYLWYTLRHGYFLNPMEVQARKAEDEPRHQN